MSQIEKNVGLALSALVPLPQMAIGLGITLAGAALALAQLA
jgi:hypothetical protein